MMQIKYSIWTLCEMRCWLPYMPWYVYGIPLKEDRISSRGWFYSHSTLDTIVTIFGNEGYLVSDADPSRVSSMNQGPNNILSGFVLLDRFLLFKTGWILFYYRFKKLSLLSILINLSFMINFMFWVYLVFSLIWNSRSFYCSNNLAWIKSLSLCFFIRVSINYSEK